MKEYKFLITIREGSDEFWEGLENDNKSGCDEVKSILLQEIPADFLNYELKLVSFTNESD